MSHILFNIHQLTTPNHAIEHKASPKNNTIIPPLLPTTIRIQPHERSRYETRDPVLPFIFRSFHQFIRAWSPHSLEATIASPDSIEKRKQRRKRKRYLTQEVWRRILKTSTTSFSESVLHFPKQLR